MPVNNQQPIPQGGIFFDMVSSETLAYNYLVSPGNTVYLLNLQEGRFYIKTFNSFRSFNLDEDTPQQQEPAQNGSLSREEILQMIRDELHQYNPHIPKKDRRDNVNE